MLKTSNVSGAQSRTPRVNSWHKEACNFIANRRSNMFSPVDVLVPAGGWIHAFSWKKSAIPLSLTEFAGKNIQLLPYEQGAARGFEIRFQGEKAGVRIWEPELEAFTDPFSPKKKDQAWSKTYVKRYVPKRLADFPAYSAQVPEYGTISFGGKGIYLPEFKGKTIEISSSNQEGRHLVRISCEGQNILFEEVFGKNLLGRVQIK